MAKFIVGKTYKANVGFYDFMAPMQGGAVKQGSVFKVIERQVSALPWYLNVVIEQDGMTRTLTMDDEWESQILSEFLEEVA